MSFNWSAIVAVASVDSASPLNVKVASRVKGKISSAVTEARILYSSTPSFGSKAKSYLYELDSPGFKVGVAEVSTFIAVKPSRSVYTSPRRY